MGVADNKTYRDTYYFRGDFADKAEDNPSVKGPEKINQTIKENPYRSNVEIEGGELVLQPDLSALFKAEGKKHSRGGMDVLLRPNAFVFSDFKDLAITKDEKELFELKTGGTNKATKNTPAQVVKKNVDVKHYNTLINNISDPYKDDLARKSSAMMLEKYIGTLGNIAYIQEAKKNFPDGLPDFSMGSAPVFDEDLKNNIDETKQYAKEGGVVNPYTMQLGGPAMRAQIMANQGKRPAVTTNPNNPQTNWGLWKGDKLPIFRNMYGKSNAADKITNLDDIAQFLGYNGPKDNKAFQQWLYNSSPENKAIIDKWHKTYGEPNIGKPASSRNRFDGIIGTRWTNALAEMKTPVPQINTFSEPPPNAQPAPTPAPQPGIPNPTPGQVTGDPQGSKRAEWEFTPWQKISQAYNWGQYAGVRRHMPFRSRYNATYADPSLLNPEQTIGDVKGQVTQQLNALNTLNPIMRNAQAAASFGQALNAIPGIRTQYDNQNAQIANQFRQYNNQVRNNESMVNMGNDQQYYQQAIEGRKNFENMRTYTANTAMNNTMRDVETNQKLAYNLLTQNNPAYSFDWKTGDFTRNWKDIRDSASGGTSDRYNSLLQALEAANDPQSIEKVKQLIKIEGLKTFAGAQQQDPRLLKKGGKMKKNPYK